MVAGKCPECKNLPEVVENVEPHQQAHIEGTKEYLRCGHEVPFREAVSCMQVDCKNIGRCMCPTVCELKGKVAGLCPQCKNTQGHGR